MFNQRNKCILILIGALVLVAVTCRAEDYDEDGPQGGNYQGDGDNYNGGGGGGGGYGNEDGYSGNMPNYQQNVDSEGTNNSPSQYNPQSNSEMEGDYDGDDSAAAAAASEPQPTVVRVRRSTDAQVAEEKMVASESIKPKLRVKRHGKYYIGPVYTYVKTDKHANFKWGVKHKVGKKHYG